jgi:hypothetical protein
MPAIKSSSTTKFPRGGRWGSFLKRNGKRVPEGLFILKVGSDGTISGTHTPVNGSAKEILSGKFDPLDTIGNKWSVTIRRDDDDNVYTYTGTVRRDDTIHFKGGGKRTSEPKPPDGKRASKAGRQRDGDDDWVTQRPPGT